MPGFPAPHHLPEFAQAHVHCIGDAIQLFHPLLPSSSVFNLFQHQGLFQWASCSHQVAKALEPQLLFFLQLFVKPPQTTTLPCCSGMVLFAPPGRCYGPLSIVLQALCLLDLMPWIYLSPLLYVFRRVDLSCTGWPSGFPHFSSLSLNVAMRSWWSEPSQLQVIFRTPHKYLLWLRSLSWIQQACRWCPSAACYQNTYHPNMIAG